LASRNADLLRRKLGRFSLDALVTMLGRVGRQVTVKVKKAASVLRTRFLPPKRGF
jgi:hypothetical protein